MQKQYGFSLIELIIFIAVIGILASGLLLGMNQVLGTAAQPEQNSIATQLAKERMELILGQRNTSSIGYASFTDPCTGPGPAICTLPAGFSILQPTITVDVNPNFSTITVTVTGPGSATLRSRVAND